MVSCCGVAESRPMQVAGHPVICGYGLQQMLCWTLVTLNTAEDWELLWLWATYIRLVLMGTWNLCQAGTDV